MIVAEEGGSLDSAVAYYFECLDRGEAVDETELVARFPQHAAELRNFFADQRLLNAKMQHLRSKVPATASAVPNRLSVRCPIAVSRRKWRSIRRWPTLNAPPVRADLVSSGSTATNGWASLMTMGRFQLLGRLGVGAYGSVWKARDDELDRIVAVKIPRQGGMTAEEQEKFFREARAAHPVSWVEIGIEMGPT